ncbi:MAG TPA: hypothetical protein VII47_15355, partial [Actinomycetota bacterium]
HKSFGLTGRQAESAIRECHLTLNRNALPFDANGPWYTSGLRLGTAAATTLGMGPDEMREVADIVQVVLSRTRPAIADSGPQTGKPSPAKFELEEADAGLAKRRVIDLLTHYPLYPEIDLDRVLGMERADASGGRTGVGLARGAMS